LSDIQTGRVGGRKPRKPFSKVFKKQLVIHYGGQCAICNTHYEERYLQIDHRIPYEIAGDDEIRDLNDYMLVCGSCNRAKSWSCEHCANFLNIRYPELCRHCYWASPSSYEHIALRLIRRLDITWLEDETVQFDQLKSSAEGQDFPRYVKQILKDHLSK